MSQLNFPDNPLNGQLYPNPCPTGVTQYRWDSSTGIWRIVGVATGVVPGTYGDSINVGQFSVDVQGNVTQAANIAIRNATLTLTGVVQLEDTLTSVSTSRALTAAAGKRLQDQIGNLNTCIVPNNANVVLALNDLQNQTFQLQQGAMIWCGYYKIHAELPTHRDKRSERFISNHAVVPHWNWRRDCLLHEATEPLPGPTLVGQR
jgi:hypothetical protein